LAEKGQLHYLAGIDEKYEIPEHAITIDAENIEKGVEKIIESTGV
jgi:adenylylsulfate kinase-like enzyme